MFGAAPVSSVSFGGRTPGIAPTVTVTGPTGTVASGGPQVNVTWSSTHPWGLAQSFFRVRVVANTLTVYDSGRRQGSETSWPVNLVDAGVAGDATVDVVVTVEVGAGGVSLTGSDSETVTLQWGQPVAVVVTPANSSVASPPVEVTWTYADTASKPQSAYRVEVLSGVTSARVFDSGWLTGSATTYPVPYPFSTGSWRVRLTTRNIEGVPSSAATSRFTVNPSIEVAPPEPNPQVGTIYEVGVNGEGFMLYDGRDERQDWRYRRRVVPLEAPRLSTGDTPFNQAFDRYSFGGLYDFTGGAGQSFYQRGDTSSAEAFLSSTGIDVTDRTHLRLLHSVESVSSFNHSSPLLVAAGDRLVAVNGAKTLRSITTSSQATINLATVLATTNILDLTSDGENWYVAGGADGVIRGTTSAPGSAWSAETAEVCEWAANRLCVAYAGAGSSTPNVFSTLNDAGAEEVNNGRLALPPGWRIRSITSGGTFVYFCADRGSQSAVWAWRAGSQDAPSLAAEIPWGHVVHKLFYYQGQVLLRAVEKNGASWDVHLYRAPEGSEGTLSLFLLHTFNVSTAAQATSGEFAATEKLVFYGWNADEGPGLGAVDLSTGGYSRWVSTTGTGAVGGVARWEGRTVFAVAGVGVIGEAAGYVASGQLQTSTWDGGGSTLSKVWDRVTVTCAPLNPGESVKVRYSTDGGITFAEPEGGALSTVGATSKTWDLTVQSASLSLELELAGNGSSTPDVSVVEVKYHPSGISDTLIELPITCFDNVAGLNGKLLPEQSGQTGVGAAKARMLEGLAQQVVLFQDIDWRDSDATELFEVLSVDSFKVSLMDQNRGKQSTGKIVVLTLRKSGS